MYRIEKDGIGPYRHSCIIKNGITTNMWMDQQHSQHQILTPVQDEIISKIFPFIELASKRYPKDVIYAFYNKIDLKQSFSEEELKKLHNLGFVIKEYTMKDYYSVIQGETQCVVFKTEESYHYYEELLLYQAKIGFIPF